ncbi:MAG: MATE family efflux transporter [Bacteroidales bacterium]|nr:MATE family efflux transporter [Bacteroidales bacterium]
MYEILKNITLRNFADYNKITTFAVFWTMKDLTQGHIGGNILKFAAPMLLGNIFQQAYNIVDSIIVGKLVGVEALAAVGASFPIIFTLISFVIGIASGGTIVISQYFGAKDYKSVVRTIDTLYIFIFFASILISTIGITFSEEIFRMTDLPEEVIPDATTYLNTILFGTVLFFGFNGTSAILRGLGDSVTPLVFLIIASILNIALDIIFIKYFGMGTQGAALATVIAHGGAFLAAILYLNRTHKLVRLRLNQLVFDWGIFWKSFRIGVPSGLQHTFVSLGMLALFRIVNGFGTNVIAAYTVAGRIDNLAMLPAMNFGQALSTFVGQNMGANKPNRVRSGLLATLGMSSFISILLTVLILSFKSQLMGLFTNDANVISIGMKYLVIVSSCYIIFSTMFSLNGVLRGAGDTIVPMFITLFSLWIIRVPLAAVLSGNFNEYLHNNGLNINLPELFSGTLQEVGIWWAIPIGWLTGAIFSFIYYLTGNWRKKVIVKYTDQNLYN